MPSSQEIETTMIADFRARLKVATAIPNLIEGTTRREEDGAIVFPIVSVGLQDITPDIIDGGGQAPGFYRVTMLLDCLSHVDDDITGAAVRALAKDVRERFLLDDIVTLMTGISTFNTYFTVQVDAG